MPPKSVPKRTQDWSWLDDVTSVNDITLAHRRSAAGLGPPGKRCALRKGSTREGKGEDKGKKVENGLRNGVLAREHNNNNNDTTRKRALSVGEEDDSGNESTATEGSVVFVRESTCTPKLCRSNPRCYNHLGMDSWWNGKAGKSARELYVEDHAGDEPKRRDRPAGLKNYGATCYANAFLQVWFHNVAFRNGVYEAVGDKVNPLYHLADIFAMMQHSHSPVVDPGQLIEALRLNKGNQQDAAEFSKLFMTLVADQFKRQGGPLADFVNEQFAGKMVYRTECNTCGYSSGTNSTFLEIEVPLEDKASLEDRIKHILRPEALDGDNKYRCPSCASLQPATRWTHLSELPPVLHFALNRFEYSAYSEARQKSKARIHYPRQLSIGDKMYDLRGVVVHEGTSALRGHFTCDVYDEADGEWYFCSDETVEKLSERPRKKPRLDSDIATDELVSRDAYLLVYKLRGEADVVAHAPAKLLEGIEAANVVLDQEIEGREGRIQKLEADFEQLVKIKEDLLDTMQGDDCVVARDTLVAWFAADDPLAVDWTTTTITCPHGGIEPFSSDVVLISREAYNQLADMGAFPDDPEPLDVCAECVREEYMERSAAHTHAQHVAEFDRLREDGPYLLPRAWVAAWRKGKHGGESPTECAASLLCEHSKPAIDGKRYLGVAEECIVLLQSVFGDFPVVKEGDSPCPECTDAQAASKAERDAWAAQVKIEKPIFTQHWNQKHVFNTKNYIVPRRFATEWKEYLDQPCPRPVLAGVELCEHGLLDFDPTMEDADYVTAAGWQRLCELYDCDVERGVSVQFGARPEEGARYAVHTISKPTCRECTRARLADWEAMELPVIVGEDGVPFAPATGRRRVIPRARKAKELDVAVTKDTTVRDIRVQLYQRLKVSPLAQRILYNGRELDAEDTMRSIGLGLGDHFNVVEVVAVDDIEDGGPEYEGFGGTALVGQKSCPHCTLLNDPDATECSMCQLPM